MTATRRLVPRRGRTSPACARLTLALLVAGAVGACASGTPIGEGGVPRDAAPEAAGDAVLEVVNQSNYDVRVLVHSGGQYHRLGLVTSMRTAQLPLPPRHLAREVRFLADPVGARRRQLTDAIVVRPGSVVRFALETELRSHTLTY